MHCTICQAELDIDGLCCPRCAAPFPRQRGIPVSVKVRTCLTAGLMLFFSTLILTKCILPVLPDLSPQSAENGTPTMKSTDVQRLLQNWAAGEQQTEGGNPPKVKQ